MSEEEEGIRKQLAINNACVHYLEAYAEYILACDALDKAEGEVRNVGGGDLHLTGARTLIDKARGIKTVAQWDFRKVAPYRGSK